MTDTFSEPRVIDRQRSDLAEILPHDMEGPAPNRCSLRIFHDAKFLDGLVDGDVLFAEQDALGYERSGERLDPRDIRGACAPHDER